VLEFVEGDGRTDTGAYRFVPSLLTEVDVASLTFDQPDDVWLVDSTPVECGRSRETAKRSDLAGWAEYGYCASHSRFFWGLRLHLITTPSGLPIAYALAGAKTDERDTALDMIALGGLGTPGQTLIADKGYRRASFETELADAGITLIRPAMKSEPARPGRRYLRAFRQIIESVNQTFKSQLDLERHGGRTKPGVCARVLQRILALTAAIWHNETADQPGPARFLIAYDHYPLGTNRLGFSDDQIRLIIQDRASIESVPTSFELISEETENSLEYLGSAPLQWRWESKTVG